MKNLFFVAILVSSASYADGIEKLEVRAKDSVLELKRGDCGKDEKNPGSCKLTATLTHKGQVLPSLTFPEISIPAGKITVAKTGKLLAFSAEYVGAAEDDASATIEYVIEPLELNKGVQGFFLTEIQVLPSQGLPIYAYYVVGPWNRKAKILWTDNSYALSGDNFEPFVRVDLKPASTYGQTLIRFSIETDSGLKKTRKEKHLEWNKDRSALVLK